MKNNNINKRAMYTLLLFSTILVASCSKEKGAGGNITNPVTPTQPVISAKSDVAMWLTQGDQGVLLKQQNLSLNFGTSTNTNPTIEVDTTQIYQTIDGFGFTLTGGSATVINQLPATQKANLIKELFATDSSHIGISYLRISLGASDLSAAPFTYDEGAVDNNLTNFSIDQERADLIPVLKSIIAINPSIKILACPWTAPTWMKTNNSFKAGSLNTAYYDAYARYFVKFIQAMKAEGITIDAITPQNEPLNPNNNPSMVMQAPEEAAFIKNNLGPQFQSAGIATKIIVYDHNADRPDYPLAILADNDASKYVDGSAFHLYGGAISVLGPVHDAYPNKNFYFTEQWVGAPSNFQNDLQWAVNNLIIGATRNWSRNVLEWNLATDASYGPHTAGGCSTCLGALTISNTISRNVSYYIIGQASKFVRPGSVRIGSNNLDNLQNVAFKTPDGKKALIVSNTTSAIQTFNIKFNGKMVSATLAGMSVATFIW
jgi:glucosylceramidase